MSELTIEQFTIPGASLGPATPLVPLWYDTADLAVPRKPIGLSEEDVKHQGYGYHHGCLPYFVQDTYDRARTLRGFKAAVLENEYLRATFLLELGGRLWSLYDKRSRRELLLSNPVFQPANLGLRNAWVSGGVEWNFCWMGHTPFTCDSLFAARTQLDDGTPVLRMWEYERVRGMTFQIDAWLPDGSPVLLVRVRLANLDDRTVPVYWWSNMAVPERKDMRVMVPAAASHQWAPEACLERHDYPVHKGRDFSYPTNAPNSGDRFFRIESPQYPWIASVDGGGSGFFQSSTRRLIGRKLWVFGQNAGGRRWQDALSIPGNPYVEIQAGLARTQTESLPLPPRTEWEWLEAYGAIDGANPGIVHGADWTAAWQETQRVVDANVTVDTLERLLAATGAMARQPPREFIQKASGWGALENRRRARDNQGPCGPASLPFPDDTLGPEQAPWLELLETGVLPETAPNVAPASWMIQDEWRERLEESIRAGKSDHWLAWLHLGIMHLGEAWDFDKARGAWEKSVACKPNAWAYRMLGALAVHRKQYADAAAVYPRALELAPDNLRLVIECGHSLVEAGCARQWLAIVSTLPAGIRGHGHIKIYEAIAAIAIDDLDRAGRILREPFELAEVREGETISVKAWFAYQEKLIARDEGIPIDETLRERVRKECPPPAHLDFRL